MTIENLTSILYYRVFFLHSASGPNAHLLPLASVRSGVPEQIKVSLTSRAGEMVISWVTWTDSKSNVRITAVDVVSGIELADSEEMWTGRSIKFIDPNDWNLVRYVHTVLVGARKAGAVYQYQCGDVTTGVMSQSYTFKMTGAGYDITTIAVYGDMGIVNSQSLKYLAKDVNAGTVDIVLHIGQCHNHTRCQGYSAEANTRTDLIVIETIMCVAVLLCSPRDCVKVIMVTISTRLKE